SVALCLLSLAALFLVGIAGRTALSVLRYWDPASDGPRQIRLENETWLSSTLVQYALGFQILSLVLFTSAADNFSQVISGAMCATGALTANPFGLPALYLKLVGAFFYGFWIVLHYLDISSERYPLLKTKYIFLVCLLPLLIVDAITQTLYIANLKPDIITSCCAVVFGEGGGSDGNLLGIVPQDKVLIAFYCLAALLATCGHFLFRKLMMPLLLVNGVLWLCFIGLSFVAITTVFSSYVYAMPYHHCPFCILKPEYGYIGFLMYGTMLPAGFFGIASALVCLIPGRLGLDNVIGRFQKSAVLLSSIMLMLFVTIVSYHYVIYRFLGGER
ncbi:MAG: hypothetical protein Q8J76_05095, partial [Desulfobulbaceae bacterium]|nr:hypothetical protein [Desulfobulbaceae bacterium]